MQYKKSAERIVLRKFSGEGVNPNYRFRPLPPQYVVGFVDGEGSFSVSTNIHKTLKRKVKIRPEFEKDMDIIIQFAEQGDWKTLVGAMKGNP